ncbi:DUF4278 domain-containing protein [Chroococcus sp. FPU101]|uniref:DUF4278 domain-containing protein n=1 Tax=Chroococcus sp. FPU101 TaxID=1974212 RepID=UPI001A8FA607|nr:DUF4278 domain-containing protein [Chroococcus sp. FPU101]GFE71549.1 hypothetical protein CFPU101_41590 [Chroococcus sp. FPU101]
MELFYRGLANSRLSISLFIPQAQKTCKYRGVTYIKPRPLNIPVQPTSVLKYRGTVYYKQTLNLTSQSVNYKENANYDIYL